MNDRPVNLGCVVAYALWAATVTLLGLSWLSGNLHLAGAACAVSAAAATATVRMYFVTSNRMIRLAFEYGRETQGEGVSRIR